MAIYNIYKGNYKISIISVIIIIKFGDYVGYLHVARYNNFAIMKAFRIYINT